MPYGLYLSAAGADVQSKRLEVLANNLANVDSTGFKRELSVLRARHSEAIEQHLDSPGSGAINDVGGGVLMQETVTNFAPGTLKRTGIGTDMAINGEGFFVVDKGGERRLTRAGNFSVTQEGRLVTQQGYPVLSAEGAAIVLDPNRPFRVLGDGTIVQGGDRIPLALEQPASQQGLAHDGDNLFRAVSDTTPLADEQRKVREGFLEQSNVSATGGMMELIEATRAYEANVRLIQSQDQTIGTLLSRVLQG